MLGHEEIAEDIGAERALDLRGIDLANIVGLVLLGRIVDQNVQPAELLDCLLHCLPAQVLAADIAGDLDGATALSGHRGHGLVGIPVLLEIDDCELSALARHRHRHCPSDPGIAARDQRHLALEPARSRILRCVVRPRPHRGLAAGLVFLFLGRLWTCAHLRAIVIDAFPR